MGFNGAGIMVKKVVYCKALRINSLTNSESQKKIFYEFRKGSRLHMIGNWGRTTITI